VENLAAAGVRAHRVFKLSQILDMVVEAGELSAEKRDEILAWVRG
jgi:hypothetical protein